MADTETGSWLKRRKQRKLIEKEAERLRPLIEVSLNQVRLGLQRLPQGRLVDGLERRRAELQQRLDNPPPSKEIDKASAFWSLVHLRAGELAGEIERALSLVQVLRERATDPLGELAQVASTSTGEVQRSLNGELARIRLLSNQAQESFQSGNFDAAENTATQVRDAVQAVPTALSLVVAPAVLQTLQRVSDAIGRLPTTPPATLAARLGGERINLQQQHDQPPPALAAAATHWTNLQGLADTLLVRAQEGESIAGRLDALAAQVQQVADVAALAQGAVQNFLNGEHQRLQNLASQAAFHFNNADVGACKRHVEQVEAGVQGAAAALGNSVAPGVKNDLDAALVDINKLPAGQLKTTLTQLHAGYEQRRTAVHATLSSAGAQWTSLIPQAADLKLRAATAEQKSRNLAAWAIGKLSTLEASVNHAPVEVQNHAAPELRRLRNLRDQAITEFNEERFADSDKTAGSVYHACNLVDGGLAAAPGKIVAHTQERGRVAGQIATMQQRMRTNPAVAGQVQRLTALLQQIDDSASKLDFDNAQSLCDTVADVLRIVKNSADAKRPYDQQRVGGVQALDLLRRHDASTAITFEIGAIGRALTAADDLGSAEHGGWQKALVSLAIVRDQIEKARLFADAMLLAQRRRPEIERVLRSAGIVDPTALDQLANDATTILAEEGCDEADAVAMARLAKAYLDEGLPMNEAQARMSARVAHTLEAEGIDPAVALEVGRGLRCGGTANGIDAKAVGRQLARLSPAALLQIRQGGFTNEVCRGPMTEIDPGSSDEHPRGWPDGDTWDIVPGACCGGLKKVVIGTMDDGAGGRKVPGPREGPLRHGTPDLVGHECGHAFDSSGGGALKCTDSSFLQARTEAVTAGQLVPGTDNYFLTRLEGGTNTSGATSETFAESFAMHFAGNARWARMETFWASNPWGV